MVEMSPFYGLYSQLFHFCYVYIAFSCVTQTFASSVPKDVSTTSDTPKILYLSQHCRTMLWNLILDHDYVFLDDEAYVMVHPLSEINNGPEYLKQRLCVVTFAAPPSHQLLLHLLDVAIDYRPSHKSRLYIFDGFNAEVKLSPYNGLFGETKAQSDTFTNVITKDYVSHYQALTLIFSGSLSRRFYGFKAVLTPVRRPYRNGTCPPNLHLCVKNRFCIERSLVCNNVPNCGDHDNSDEGQQCNTDRQYHLSHTNLDDLGLMIGCGVSFLVLVLAIIWVAVLLQRRHRLRRQRLQLTTSMHQNPRVLQQSTDVQQSLTPARFPCQIRHGFYQWICPDGPPPSYSESGNNDQGCVETPPPYSQVAQDPPVLVQPAVRQSDAMASNSGNGITDTQPPSSPPAYSDINQGSALPLLSETREGAPESAHPNQLKDEGDADNRPASCNEVNDKKEHSDASNEEM